MYKGLQSLDEELQSRHEQQQRVLAATITMHEAVARYGLVSKKLYERLREAGCWPAIKGRWYIADVEAVLGVTRKTEELPNA